MNLAKLISGPEELRINSHCIPGALSADDEFNRQPLAVHTRLGSYRDPDKTTPSKTVQQCGCGWDQKWDDEANSERLTMAGHEAPLDIIISRQHFYPIHSHDRTSHLIAITMKIRALCSRKSIKNRYFRTDWGTSATNGKQGILLSTSVAESECNTTWRYKRGLICSNVFHIHPKEQTTSVGARKSSKNISTIRGRNFINGKFTRADFIPGYKSVSTIIHCEGFDDCFN